MVYNSYPHLAPVQVVDSNQEIHDQVAHAD